jgi:hypothetical protein
VHTRSPTQTDTRQADQIRGQEAQPAEIVMTRKQNTIQGLLIAVAAVIIVTGGLSWMRVAEVAYVIWG